MKIGKLLRIANNILVKDFNTRPFIMYVKNNSDGKLKCVEVGVREDWIEELGGITILIYRSEHPVLYIE